MAEGKSTKLKQFRYSVEEREVIAECLPGIPRSANDSDWHKIVGLPSIDDWRRNKTDLIAADLERAAAYCIGEFHRTDGVEFPSKAQDIETVKRIVKLASELRRLLAAPNSFRPTYISTRFSLIAGSVENFYSSWPRKPTIRFCRYLTRS